MRRVDFAALPAVAAKRYHQRGAINRKITGRKSMAGKWMVVALGVGMITTLINAGIFVGQFSTSANARAAATAALSCVRLAAESCNDTQPPRRNVTSGRRDRWATHIACAASPPPIDRFHNVKDSESESCSGL